jgi:two-component system, NarL family, nitrate/nitrite response regulator NarL
MGDDLRIVIGEDHPVFRDGLKRALSDGGFRIVGEAGDGQSAYELIRTLRPDVAVVDIGLPGMDGCAVARRVCEERLPVALVFLTVCDEVEIFEQALSWGVKGYLLKDATSDEIVRCMRAVSAGQHFVSPAMTTHLVERTQRVEHFSRQLAALQRLTPHERLILKRIALERQSKEIAAELGIAPRTVDAHRANICQKLGLHGNHVLRRFALRHRDQL